MARGVRRGQCSTIQSLTTSLDVEAQEVVPIQAGSRSGSVEVETGMRAMEVILMQPYGEVLLPLEGVLVGAGVGPFAESSLDDRLRLLPNELRATFSVLALAT